MSELYTPTLSLADPEQKMAFPRMEVFVSLLASFVFGH